VSIVLLILFAFSPLQLVNPPLRMVIILEVAHVVAGGALIYALTRA